MARHLTEATDESSTEYNNNPITNKMLRLMSHLTLALSSLSVLALPTDIPLTDVIPHQHFSPPTSPPRGPSTIPYTGTLTFNPLHKRALDLPNNWRFILKSQPTHPRTPPRLGPGQSSPSTRPLIARARQAFCKAGPRRQLQTQYFRADVHRRSGGRQAAGLADGAGVLYADEGEGAEGGATAV
ncbi:hypothetical protein XPA_008870 [Xanthoria parietina]